MTEDPIDKPDPNRFPFGPTTRYQGSKRKILPWLWSHLSKLEFTSVLDVFGGTASVSYALKRMGKEVIYNDFMKWNHNIGLALIENNSTRLTNEEISRLLAPVKSADAGAVSRNYRGIFFTKQENLWIDAVSQRISEIPGRGKKRQIKQSVASYALYQTCMAKRPFNMFHRANLNLRLSNVERTFGNKTTWDRRFQDHFRTHLRELHSSIIPGRHECKAINTNADDLPPMDVDLVYLDPPYIIRGRRNETANYYRCYNFLESLAHYSNIEELLDESDRLKRIPSKAKNSWLDPDSNKAALDALIEKFPSSIIAISYKKFGDPSIESIIRLLRKHGRSVTMRSTNYKYALNKNNGSAPINRECLIIGI